MPCHHVQHARKVGPNLFTHNENSAYIMPHVTTHAVTSCAQQASQPPYVYMAHQKLLTDMPFAQAK